MYQYRKLTKEQQNQLVKERLQKKHPSHTPPHLIINQPYYLITAACYEHKHRLNTVKRRQFLFEQITQILTKQNIQIGAWVILPNHYHFLISNVNFVWLSKELRLIHGRTAYQWNLEDGVKGKIWCSYSDRAIRSEKHYYTVLNYIHYNPVKHGFANSPYDWKHSSVHKYLQEKGRDWLRSCWVEYPIKDYGQEWDV